MKIRFLKKKLGRYFPFRLYQIYKRLKNIYDTPAFGYCSASTQIGYPFLATRPQNVFLYEYTRINPGAKIITYTGKFVLKKYSVIAYGCTIITGNHTPTVGIPQYVLGHSHINDKERDVIVEEDVWIGANVTLLSGSHIGRGCVVGACSLVNKAIPPYAVIVGIPARIIASKFTIDQIIKHEEKLYPVEDRFTKEELEILFSSYYAGKRSIGVDSKSLFKF